MFYLNTPERLITWLDVERTLKEETRFWKKLPEGIHAVDCYQDEMIISHSCEELKIRVWLTHIFGKAFSGSVCAITLRAGNGKYAVIFEKVLEQKPLQIPSYPQWSDIAYLDKSTDQADVSISAVSQFPENFGNGPQLIAFHSFKGGVGRTTALMTYVAARLNTKKANGTIKILIIDADLEAPGVTFWIEGANKPQVSFLKFLEATHYPPVSLDASLKFFADELKKTSFNVDGSQREIYVLPAALNLSEIEDMPVQPRHLMKNNPANPWILTDHIHQLGKILGVDSIFIDLRAGLSELSSQFIFDPRIEHYFVTTVAKQSIEGTSEILRKLHIFNSALPPARRRDAMPSVVLSMLTPELRKSSEFNLATESIEKVYPPVGDNLDAGVEWLEADFSPTLMSISSFREAFDKLKQSTLYESGALEWANNIENKTDGISFPLAYPEHRISPEQLLFNFCEKEYAENNVTDDWLLTDPLRNLGKHYSKDIPNAVLVGAKGAGKTFTYLQICKSKTWNNYLKRVNVSTQEDGINQNRIIYPVLWSENVDGNSKMVVLAAQSEGLKSLQLHKPSLEQSKLKSKIRTNLENESSDWDTVWESVISDSLGGGFSDLHELNKYLLQQQKSLVLVFDGLEDTFSDSSSVVQQRAIESLLKLVNRLGELPDQSIGALVFVRIDYVEASIKQNLGQFLSRFDAFQLVWNPESFLRLAYWFCAKAEIIDAHVRDVLILSIAQLIKKLEKLWGYKLGKNASKESLSARWVYAALCDLRGSFQARDLVRFFKFAAEEQIKTTSTSWNDRVLAPTAMRSAIPQCSTKKVEEAIKEFASLRAWKQRMTDEKIQNKSIPFSAISVALEPAELVVLRELGVIYEDIDPLLGDKRLFLPEIYRTGLGFDLSSGRPKIQALLKKNLGKMPF